LEDKIDEITHWVEAHPQEDKDAYDAKQKELESVAMPIMSKLAGEAGGPGGPGGFPGGGFPGGGYPGGGPGGFGGDHPTSSGPTVDDVD